MRPRPAGNSFHHHRWVALTIAILVGGGLCLADSMPVRTGTSAAVQVELTADRRVGLAPVSIAVSGTLRDAGQLMVPLADGEHAVLEVSWAQMNRPGENAPVLNNDAAEFRITVLEEPMNGHLILQSPGTYTLRWLVEDANGNLLRSNEVQVRVL